MTYTQKHYAECSECGKIERVEDNGSFITPFFLPDICPRCGETMQGRWPDESRPHWIHVIKKKRYEPAARTKNPLTWLRIGQWVTVKEHRWPA
jgi:rRNA maturation protein Nop10